MSIGEITTSLTLFVKTNGPTSIKVFDQDDACMKAAIASFEILRGSPQAIALHLRELSPTVIYASEDGTKVDFENDKEASISACAAKSVLKVLHSNGCVGKDVVTFQSRRGDLGTIPSDIAVINLNDNIRPPFSIKFGEGIISHTYAYLSERKLCLFFNNISPDTLNKIDGILAGMFPRHNKNKRSVEVMREAV